MKGLRSIKNKIKAVKNLGKIAQAMALVSVNKMRKAQSFALKARPMARTILEILKGVRMNHFLLKENKKAKKDLLIVVCTDKGLVGSLNSNILKEALNFLKSNENKTDLILIGKKAVNFFQKEKFKDLRIVATFEKFGDYFMVEQTLILSDFILEAYRRKIYKNVFIVYTHFISTLKQKVNLKRILPLNKTDFEIFGKIESKLSYFIFEPKKEKFQKIVIPMIFRILIHQFILEANASEHSARMVAMKKASDNSKKLLSKLTLEYNKIRQENITQEILDVIRASQF